MESVKQSKILEEGDINQSFNQNILTSNNQMFKHENLQTSETINSIQQSSNIASLKNHFDEPANGLI